MPLQIRRSEICSLQSCDYSITLCFYAVISSKGDEDMEIKRAETADLETVKRIVHETIRAVYPHYYPNGAVEFFIAHHCPENIMKDISSGSVYILYDDGIPVGTVTAAENELNRLFVLPEYQGRGYGGKLLSFAEERIAERYDNIVLSASLPAKPIYMRKGYTFKDYNSIKCEGGDYLCYDEMEKKL